MKPWGVPWDSVWETLGFGSQFWEISTTILGVRKILARNTAKNICDGAMTTVLKGSTWNFHGLIRASVPTKLISRNFHFGGLRLGKFCGLPNFVAMGEKLSPSFSRQVRLFYHGLSYFGLSLMIQVQSLVGDLHRGHLGSYDIIWGHQQVSANNSLLKRGRDMGMVSLCLHWHEASTDMQHTYLGQHLTSGDLDLWSNIDLTFLRSPFTWFDAPWRKEQAGARIESLSFLIQKLFAKNDVGKKTAVFIPGAQTADASRNLMVC